MRTSLPPPPERRWSPQWNRIPRLDLPRQKMRAQQSGIEYVLDVKVGLQVLNEACVADSVASIPLMGQARSVQCSGRFMDGVCLGGNQHRPRGLHPLKCSLGDVDALEWAGLWVRTPLRITRW